VLNLPEGSRVLDLGCGDGKHALELAARFGFVVHGVDRFQTPPPTADPRVTFEAGSAEAIPLPDASVDLIWCRDMLVHIPDLAKVFAECRRVLRPGAPMLVLHSLGTDRLAPAEADWLWQTMHVVPSNADAAFFESALSAARLAVETSHDVGSEWREYREESTGQSRALHAARILRDPDRYIAQFGQDAYNIMLGDCYWHVYQLLGKLTYRIYVLRAY
jgi:SAM-dependent methyltransferase